MPVDNAVLADIYAQSIGMLKMHLADVTDAEMLARPCGAANHIAWQLGHMIATEIDLINAATPGALPPPPAEFRERHTKVGAARNEGFSSKAELLALFESTRLRTIAWVKSLRDADMARPMPEAVQGFAKTVGHLAVMIPVHDAMHCGQFQVVRRSLGKPVLF
jgi:hypothetical protein